MTCGCGEKITAQDEQESNRRCLSRPHCSECLNLMPQPDPNCPFCEIPRKMGRVVRCVCMNLTEEKDVRK